MVQDSSYIQVNVTGAAVRSSRFFRYDGGSLDSTAPNHIKSTSARISSTVRPGGGYTISSAVIY